MIVWLPSYPRSGNTLFRLVLHQTFGQNTYSVYNDPKLYATRVGRLLGQQQFDKRLVQRYQSSEQAIFVKTHGANGRGLEWEEQFALHDQSPVIYIVRDGRDALVSYTHYRMEIENVKGSFRDNLTELIVSQELWGGWSRHIQQWLTRPSSRSIAIVRFEDLLIYPVESVRIALTHIGLEHLVDGNYDHLESFSKLQRMYPKFFRKGKVGGWRDEMPADLEELFWNKHQMMMRYMGYVR